MGFSNYGKQVVLTGAVYRDVLLHQHFPVFVFVAERRGFWLAIRMQASKNLLYVHFCHPVWSSVQAIVFEVEPQGEHDIPDILGNALDFFGVTQYKSIFPHGCLFRSGKMVVPEGIL